MSNLATAARICPEPSFLFNWLAGHDLKASNFLYLRLLAMYPYLANVQDAQVLRSWEGEHGPGEAGGRGESGCHRA